MNRQLWTIALSVWMLAGLASAQDVQRIPDDKAKEVAKLLIAASEKLKLPVKVAPDETKGTGIHARKAVLFLIPDTKLSAEVVQKLDKGVVPIGVLYTTSVLTVVSGDKPVTSDKHNTTEVTVKNETLTIHVHALAAAKVADRPVLLVYAKDNKPVIVAELNEADEKSDHTLDLEARKAEDKRATVVLNVLGKYKAVIQVAANE